jgi:CHAP domain
MSAEAVIDRLLKIHHQELARRVTRQPINNVKYNTWYYGRPVNGEEFMWCAAYQSWINAMAGVPMDIYPKAAGVVFVRDFFKQRGRIFQTPKVGDYVIFIFGPRKHHIGFVEKLESGGRFTSMEGNFQNRVMRVRHRQGDRGIVGYARPEYDKVEEDDMTKEELIDVLRSGFSPGFDTVNEWANQLNQVKREVEELKQMVKEMKS